MKRFTRELIQLNTRGLKKYVCTYAISHVYARARTHAREDHLSRSQLSQSQPLKDAASGAAQCSTVLLLLLLVYRDFQYIKYQIIKIFICGFSKKFNFLKNFLLIPQVWRHDLKIWDRFRQTSFEGNFESLSITYIDISSKNLPKNYDKFLSEGGGGSF